MAIYKRVLFLIMLCLLLMHKLEIQSGLQIVAAAQEIDCESKCSYRCCKASRTKMCLRACNTCCERCNCVPPGTYGNQEVCPCYANLTTHDGKKKCP